MDAGRGSDRSVFPGYGSDRSALNEYMNPQYINISARVMQYAVYVRRNDGLPPIHKRERPYHTACCSVKVDRNKTPVCRGVQGGLPTWHLNGVSVSESSGDFQGKS